MVTQRGQDLVQSFRVAQILEVTRIDLLANPIGHGRTDSDNAYYLRPNLGPNPLSVML
jgi:hypothetical protein